MHGGYNSLSESVAAGVPLLVWPQMGDQYETSGWVVRNSLGARIVEGEGAGRLLNFAKEEADGWREKLRVEAEEMRRAWMDDGEAKEQLEAWIARFALGGGSSRL
jgi:UDP:flavonoid glycosyltransferase YjiC (YdhE family)